MNTRLQIAFLFLVGASLAVPRAVFLAADVQKFVFISSPQTVAPGSASEQITLQAQDAAGNEFKVPGTACAALFSTSAGGEFSSNDANWAAVSVLTIAKNSANRNFYYKDTAAGKHTISAKIVFKPETESRSCAAWPATEWPSGWNASQDITVGDTAPASSGSGNVSVGATSTEPAVPASGVSAAQQTNNNGTAWVPPPQIYVSAVVPQRGTAGAPALFDAAAVGLKKEPLPNARYVWSFGDGGTAEGKKVYHTYHYPAAYVVMVSASSGEWGATDRKEIVIAAPELILSNIKPGEDGFIELQNAGRNEIDLSFWFLKSGARSFTIPQGTIIGGGQTIPFPAAITGLSADPLNTSLLYPNGNLVAAYEEKSVAPAPAPLPARAAETVAAPAVKKEVPPEKPLPEPTVVPPEKETSLVPPPAPRAGDAEASELIGAALAAGERGITPWLWGMALFLLVSIGAYLLLLRSKSKPDAFEELRKEAAEYDIMEEVSIK